MTTRPRGAQQRWRVLAASAIALGGVLVSPSQGDATVTAASVSAPSRVIVQTADGSLTAVVKAAEKLGAHVVSTQASLDTVVVDLPTNHLDDLRDVPGVRAATRDMRVHLSSVPSVTGLAGRHHQRRATRPAPPTTGTDGFFGQGVDVALLDSGVLPVDGLTTPNKLVIGPDLSFESQVASRCAASTPSATAPTWPASSPACDTGADARRRTRTTRTTSSAWRPVRASSASSSPTRTGRPTCRR